MPKLTDHLHGCTCRHDDSPDPEWGGRYCMAPTGTVVIHRGPDHEPVDVTVEVHRDVRDGGRLHKLGVWLDATHSVATPAETRRYAFALLAAADRAERSN